jgi:hypothetical protein
MVDDFGWWTIPIVTLVIFTLYGIEVIGSQLEDPFGYDRNDIKMDAICKDSNIEMSVILAEWKHVAAQSAAQWNERRQQQQEQGSAHSPQQQRHTQEQEQTSSLGDDGNSHAQTDPVDSDDHGNHPSSSRDKFPGGESGGSGSGSNGGDCGHYIQPDMFIRLRHRFYRDESSALASQFRSSQSRQVSITE